VLTDLMNSHNTRESLAVGPPAALPRLGLARLSIAGCAPFVALVSATGGRMLPIQRWRDAAGRGALGADSVDSLLQHWSHNAALLRDVQPGPDWHPLDGLRWHAPLVPRQVYCSIGNYRAQVVEAALDAEPPSAPSALQAREEGIRAALEQRRLHGEPYVVTKPNQTVAAPLGVLPISAEQATLDWEVEIGVVIGRPTRHVSVAQALAHVAGYCTVNDITLRQRMFRSDLPAMGTDFLQAKGGPGWLPLGPCFVPAAEIPAPQALRLQLRLNGHVMQDALADDMVFGIAEQIAYLSRHVQLEPGDLLCTGSPAGFGQHHRRFLHPGDQLEAEVIGLGAQHITLQAASAP